MHCDIKQRHDRVVIFASITKVLCFSDKYVVFVLDSNEHILINILEELYTKPSVNVDIRLCIEID